MSVDKFGRHSYRKSLVSQGPKGEGFKLTPEGDYDIRNKRMRHVDEPMENGDAVNLETLYGCLVNCVQLTPDKKAFDAQFKRIGNAVDPVESSDLVTKRYLESKVPIHNQALNTYSVHQFRIKDVAYPQDSGDAVNINFLNKNCLMKSEPNVFNGDGGTIANLRDPKKGSEVATKTYVDSKTPARAGNYWSFGNKRLVSINDPVNEYDATTLSYIKKNTIHLDKTGYDAKQKVISNLAFPLHLDDAISKRFMKQVLADFGYVVYANLYKGRASIIPENEWKAKLFGESTTWEELFKLN